MTAARTLFPGGTERLRVAAAALLLALCTLALSWPTGDIGPPQASDREQLESIAFNLARHGEFHNGSRLAETRAAGDTSVYSRREPGYSLYLAAVYASSSGFESLDQECLLNEACEAAAPFRQRVWHVTFVLGAAAVALTFLATFVLARRSWPVALAAGAVSLLLMPLLLTRDIPGFLVGLLLLGHATLAAQTWQKPRLATGVLSGLCLGLLVLTRAVFQYWLAGVAVLLAVGLWQDAARRRTLAPACAALVVAAWAVTLPWMMRNAVQAGHFGISGRDGEVLAIRAEYGRMTWAEVRGAFAYYLPDVPLVGGAVRDRAMSWLEPETFGYARFDRANPEGFYRRTKNQEGDVAARADRIDPEWRLGIRSREHQVTRDAVLKQAAADQMRADWLKQGILTAVFAERGASLTVGSCNAIVGPASERYGWAIGWPVSQACGLATEWMLLFIPLAGVMVVVAWRRRDVASALLLAPVVYGFGIHAVATHFITRYSRPLIPVLVVVGALAGQEAWRRLADARQRRRTDAAGSQTATDAGGRTRAAGLADR